MFFVEEFLIKCLEVVCIIGDGVVYDNLDKEIDVKRRG